MQVDRGFLDLTTCTGSSNALKHSVSAIANTLHGRQFSFQLSHSESVSNRHVYVALYFLLIFSFIFSPDAYWIFLLLVTGIHVYLLFLIYLCSFKKSINMYVCWVCMNVCDPPQECLVSAEAKRWCWSTWDQSYRQLTAMWVLGIEPGTSGRAVSAFTSRTSPGPQWIFLICTLKM